MAKGDRVGALYYEVILDPRGFARGAAKTKTEQELLVRAIKSGTDEVSKIKAEMEAISRRIMKGTREEKSILVPYYQQLEGRLKAIADAKELAAKQKLAERQLTAEKRLAKWHEIRLRKISSIQDLYRQRNLIFAQFKDGIAGVNGGLSKLLGNLTQAAGFGPQIQGLARSFGAMATNPLTWIAGAVAALGKATMMADRFAIAQMKIERVMGGNRFAAEALTDEMEDFARVTSYSADQMQKFAVQMLNLDVGSKDIPKLAETLGVLAGGDTGMLGALGKSYTDVVSKGRLMAQEALQFANAGVGIYKEIADYYKINAADARQMVEDGLVSANDLAKVLEQAAEKRGGVGALQDGLNTITGQFAQLGQTFSKIMRDMGEPMRARIVVLMKVANKWAGEFGKIVDYVSTLKTLMDPVAVSQDQLFDKTLKFSLLVRGQLGLYKERVKLMQQLKETNKEFENDMMRAAKMESEQIQNYYDIINEDLREYTAAQQARLDFQEKINEAELTEEQRASLLIEYDKIAAKKEQLRLAEEERELLALEAQEERQNLKEFEKERDKILKRAEDADKARQKLIDDRTKAAQDKIKEDTAKLEKADQSGASSFDAGSVAEFQFLRQMEMEARRDQKVEQWENQAAADRAQMVASMKAVAAAQRTQVTEEIDTQAGYYGVNP